MNQLRLLRILCMTILMGSTALAKVVDCPSVMGESEDGVSRKCKPAHKPRKSNCCGIVTPITKVPYVIRKSGKYCVPKNLVYDLDGRAIIVQADGVTINFTGHDLRLNNLSATGIYAEGVRELTIENDLIYTPVVSADGGSNAIHLVGCQKVKLDNVFTKNTTFGVLAQNCDDLFITHSRFLDHINAVDTLCGGVRAETCKAVVVEESVFQGANTLADYGSANAGIQFRSGCQDCRVSNCEFPNSDLAVFPRQINGCIIENCIFERAANTSAIQIQIGSAADDQEGNAIIIRDCSFTSNQMPIAICAALAPLRGRDLLVENCVFNDNTIPDFRCTCVGTFGSSPGDFTEDGFPFDNAIVRGCDITCSSVNCIEIGGLSKNILIEDCTISRSDFPLIDPGLETPNLLTINNGASDITIRNNAFQNGTFRGLWLDFSQYGNVGLSSNIVIQNNVFAGCQEKGALVEENFSNVVFDGNTFVGNGDDGITIIATAEQTILLQGNKAFGNAAIGFNNLQPGATTFFNTSCQNGVANCVGISPVQLPGDSPAVAGSNVCCEEPDRMVSRDGKPQASTPSREAKPQHPRPSHTFVR